MAGGHVDRNVLTSKFQNYGDTYDDTKTESAMEVLAQQVDDNYEFTTGLISAGTLSKLGVINVKDYGGKGDGVTDDTTAILNAITAVSNAGGGTILFPQGTYLFSGLRIGNFSGIANTGNVPVITGSNNLTIEGIGNVTIKLPNGVNNDLFVFRFLSNITFKNIILDGNATNQTGVGGYKGYWGVDLSGIIARDGQGFVAENVKVINAKKFGMNISSDFKDVKISKCAYDSCDTGLDVQGSNMSIERNKFTNCATAGLMLEGEDSLNDFNVYSGLNSFVSLSKNYVKNCARGIYITGNAYSIDIKTNTVIGSSIWGICINGVNLTNGKRIDTVTCDDNMVYGCGDGINISQAVNQKLSKNKVRKNTRGIYCYNVVESELENNRVKENNGIGILFEGTSKNILIDGNDVLNNNLTITGKVAGLVVNAGNSFRILNNVCSDTQQIPTQQYGIILDGNPTDVSIDNNEFKNNVQNSLSDWLGNSQYSWINNNADKLAYVVPTIRTATAVNFGTVLPAASLANRYQLYILAGGAGVQDNTYYCRKTAADTYEWKQLNT